jgi:hypothetical protein
MVDLTVTDASAMLDGSALTISGSVELSGAAAQVVLTQKVFDAASVSVSNGAGMASMDSSGRVTCLTVSDSTMSTQSSGELALSGAAALSGETTRVVTISGSISVSDAAAQVALSQNVLDVASMSVSNGANVAITDMSGSVTGLIVADSTMSTRSSLELALSRAVSLSGETTRVDLAEIELSLSSLTAASAAALSVTACTGSMVDFTVTDASVTLDNSPLTISGSVDASGAKTQVELSQKVFDGASVSASNGATLAITDSTGSVTSLTVMDSTMDVASVSVSASQPILSGSATLSGAATHANLWQVALDAILFTVTNGANLGVAACSGSITGLVVQQGGDATVTGANFQVADETTVAVSIAEGSHFTVGNSRLVGADGGSSTPFPCDGMFAVCAGEHDGSVIVEGPAVATLALPLVCDVGLTIDTARYQFTGACKMATLDDVGYKCDDFVGSNYADTDASCGGWAAIGDCLTNFYWMSHNCCASCQVQYPGPGGAPTTG